MANCNRCGAVLGPKQFKYCSNRCQGLQRREQAFKQIEDAKRIISGSPHLARAYFLQKFGNRCQLCGRATWTGRPIPVVLDHIDGNATNWKLTNLRLICCNCDALLPTFKNRNKGNGRWARRQRYQNGQSY